MDRTIELQESAVIQNSFSLYKLLQYLVVFMALGFGFYRGIIDLKTYILARYDHYLVLELDKRVASVKIDEVNIKDVPRKILEQKYITLADDNLKLQFRIAGVMDLLEDGEPQN